MDIGPHPLAWLFVVPALWSASLAAQTSVSIYSDGRMVVRRAAPPALTKGRNVVSLEIAGDGFDPGMVFSLDSEVTIVSATARPATTRENALQRAVGSTLSFVRAKGDTVRATVLRANPPQYRLPDNRVLLVEPGEPLFPESLVRSAPLLDLVLDAARARPTTDLAWVSQGAAWSAAYQVMLEENGRATVTGTATIQSQFRAESAAVQLVAGTIGRAHPVPLFAARRMAVDAVAAAPGPAEAAVGEVHVYTLPAPVSLEAGTPVSVSLFPAVRAAVTREFVVPGEMPFRGYPPAIPADQGSDRVPVEVWYTLARTTGTPFGSRPLPGGTMQFFQRDKGGQVQLVGEAATDHTAAGKDLRVQAGNAFDITAVRVQTDFTDQPLAPAQRGVPARRRVTASYRVILSNAKPEPVKVDVREVHAGQWVIVTSSTPAEKLSASEFRFRVAIPAQGEATLTYTVQVDS